MPNDCCRLLSIAMRRRLDLKFYLACYPDTLYSGT